MDSFSLHFAFVKLVISSYLKKALPCVSADMNVSVLRCSMPQENRNEFTHLLQPHNISGVLHGRKVSPRQLQRSALLIASSLPRIRRVQAFPSLGVYRKVGVIHKLI